MDVNKLAFKVVHISSYLAFQLELEEGKKPDENTKEGTTNAAKKENKLKLYVSILSSRAMLLFLLSQFFVILGNYAFFSFSPDRAIQFGG